VIVAHFASSLKHLPTIGKAAKYNALYYRLTKKSKELGHQYIVLDGSKDYVGGNVFAAYYVVVDRLGTLKKITEEIEVGVIFNKGKLDLKEVTVPVVNSYELCLIAGDKKRQADMFKDFMPSSYTAATVDAAKKYIDSGAHDKYVLKPTLLNAGKGIQIVSSSQQLEEDKHFMPPFVIQEFIDASAGVPGIVAGVHDVRIYILNGKSEFMSVRRPVKGSLIANTHKGGSIDFFTADTIPPELKQLSRDIDRRLGMDEDRYYSCDYMRDSSGAWYLIELNDRPAIPSVVDDDPLTEGMQDRVLQILIEAGNECR